MSTGIKHQLTYFDLVRGISAQLVVLGHASVLAFPLVMAYRTPAGLLGAKPGFHVQSYGVVIFLVLSGYLIARSVKRRMDDPRHGFTGYLVDRTARIFTPLVPAMLVIGIIDLLVFRDGRVSEFTAVRHDAVTTVSNLLMLQDNPVMLAVRKVTGLDVAARSFGSAAPWWTVAIEWWIYIAFGAIVFALVKRTESRRMTALLIPLALFALATIAGVTLLGSGLALAWLVGFAYAWFPERVAAWPRLVHQLVTVLGILALVVLFVVLHREVYAYEVCLITAAAVMSGYHAAPWETWLAGARRFLAFLSDVSYSVYLIHFSVMAWLVVLLPGAVQGGWRFALLVLAGDAAGVAWWWLFERHFTKVRNWLRARVPGAVRRDPQPAGPAPAA